MICQCAAASGKEVARLSHDRDWRQDGRLPAPNAEPDKDTVSPTESTQDDDLTDPRPQRPTEPDATDCCGEGCVRCVYDIHELALERHEAALAAWRARHPEVR